MSQSITYENSIEYICKILANPVQMLTCGLLYLLEPEAQLLLRSPLV
jgi:hypothetical protein